jgi:uncharacterized protein (DUF1778 family)
VEKLDGPRIGDDEGHPQPCERRGITRLYARGCHGCGNGCLLGVNASEFLVYHGAAAARETIKRFESTVLRPKDRDAFMQALTTPSLSLPGGACSALSSARSRMTICRSWPPTAPDASEGKGPTAYRHGTIHAAYGSMEARKAIVMPITATCTASFADFGTFRPFASAFVGHSREDLGIWGMSV